MLVSAVLQEIIDESVLSLSTTSMLTYMKSALRQVSTILRYRGFKTTGTISVAALAQTASLLSLSSAFLEEIAVWYESSGTRVPIESPQSVEYFQDIYSTNGSGKPRYYDIQGTNLVFDQPVDEAITVGLEYFKEISAVALSDTFLGDERVIQAVKHMTLAHYYYEYEEDDKKGARNLQTGVGMLNKIQEDIDAHDMGGSVEISDTDGT